MRKNDQIIYGVIYVLIVALGVFAYTEIFLGGRTILEMSCWNSEVITFIYAFLADTLQSLLDISSFST